MPSKLETIVFIDGSNTYFAQKKMGKWLDWVKAKRFLEKEYEVSSFRYYAGVREGDQKTKSFLRTLAWELRKTADRFFYLEDLVELTKGKAFVRI